MLLGRALLTLNVVEADQLYAAMLKKRSTCIAALVTDIFTAA